ncbi:hypothetical protein D4S03_03375 [bacterium]|nr:MAG: hypothetical protein D4S03_03375 [bacterium]
MAEENKLKCLSCGGTTPPGMCEFCGGWNNAIPAEVKVEEETETNDSDDIYWLMPVILLFIVGGLLFLLLWPVVIRHDQEISEPAVPTEQVVVSEPQGWSAPSNVGVFTPDYILNNNVPSLLPNMVVCPNGKINSNVDGQGTCDFSDSHTSSLTGGPGAYSTFPFGDAYDTSGSFVWAYNLPDLRATKVAQVPWGTSFPWQGCFEINTGNPDDAGGGILYWTFVYGYGWIDSYQVIGGCQVK